MAANVVWVGNALSEQAQRQSSRIIKTTDDVTEYVEVWTGNPLNAAWPNYVLWSGASLAGGNFNIANIGNLIWYSLEAAQGENKALAYYTAKASDKYDLSRAKWALEYEQIFYVDPVTNLGEFVALPCLTKTTMYPLNATITTGAMGPVTFPNFPTTPFTITFPSIPLVGYVSALVNDGLTESTDGYTRQQQWRIVPYP